MLLSNAWSHRSFNKPLTLSASMATSLNLWTERMVMGLTWCPSTSKIPQKITSLKDDVQLTSQDQQKNGKGISALIQLMKRRIWSLVLMNLMTCSSKNALADANVRSNWIKYSKLMRVTIVTLQIQHSTYNMFVGNQKKLWRKRGQNYGSSHLCKY